ncbi:GspH/FimT family pseudopilin [Acinetobacter sp. WZC-1]|uniref:GspH/FimT family pseudopilin n=1 Tax=Acinetobacter sp. WZC-1 TaxID=3459034 RepID=UPI00403DEEFE
MVTIIAILAIIAVISLPAWQHFRERQETSHLHSLLRQQISSAKNHARIHRSDIMICASGDMLQCQHDQWHTGMLIFQDLNRNRQPDSGEIILSRIQTNIQYGTLEFRGGVSSPHTLTFKGDTGLPRGAQGGFHYCSFRHAKNNQYFAIGSMGHLRADKALKC